MKRTLDRATYFELKVKGIHDSQIMIDYRISNRKMSELRIEWGLVDIRTEGFQLMMKRAKIGQAYVSKKEVKDEKWKKAKS